LKKNSIQVFEHHSLVIRDTYEGVEFNKKHFTALAKLNELHNDKYFYVRHNSIKFKQYVGVIQVEGLTIEVLPKIDNRIDEKIVWQNALIEMLRETKKLKVQEVGQAAVSKQQIHLLDLYFEWYLKEIKTLIHQGLIKQYYKETKQVNALKGKLEFAGHIRKNLVHKERFYTTHQVYDKNHLIHQVLNKALEIIASFAKGSYLYHKCKSVQLDFPDVSYINVDATTFKKIKSNRKNAPYKTALAIARFIILNFAPNVTKGKEDMLALLFNMNSLWEEYVLVKLKSLEIEKNITISGQESKDLWNTTTIRPDIVLEKKGITYVIDTKWKDIQDAMPSSNDLRQMYVYNEYWNSNKSMLLYPSSQKELPMFKRFKSIQKDMPHHICGIGKVSIFNDQNTLNEHLGTEIINLLTD
jgi:5-methylcytosine-specific restriction enzyme subunit McrC